MNTEVLRTAQPAGVGNAATVMAVGIVVDRISRLSEPDRADFYELMRELREVKDAEEIEAIRVTMTEILDQEPVRADQLPMGPNERRADNLEKWIAYVSARIRELRKNAGLTQAQLAARSGLPQSHISRLEQGEHSPSHLTLEKISKAIGQPMAAFDPTE
jgi:DNA-binding transcriptional regulator YiaG